VENYERLYQSHFVDSNPSLEVEKFPKNFSKLNWNDEIFSDFASRHAGLYKRIIIDWATFRHVTREKTWKEDLPKLLAPGGCLIVPINSVDSSTFTSNTREKAEKLQQYQEFFGSSEIIPVSDQRFSLDHKFSFLRRPKLEEGRLKEMSDGGTVILVFTKRAT
jgi:hypothetical protein